MGMRSMPSVDVIIPVFNEETTVRPLVERLRRACPDASIVFVDNASTDRTLEILDSLAGVRVVRHDRNLGYGRSLRDGIEASGGDVVLMIDADLEYHPEDVPAIVAALAAAPAVYGSRLLEGAEGLRTMPWTRRTGNRVVTLLFNLLFGQRLTDLYTGIRGVRRDALDWSSLGCDGFELVLEIAARLARGGATIAEVPVRYTPRTAGVSKMNHVRELLRFAIRLLRLRLQP
jgi:glycosyltransferase involved in cell wall biosynthesis